MTGILSSMLTISAVAKRRKFWRGYTDIGRYPANANPIVNCIWKLSLTGISKALSLGISLNVWYMKVPGPATVCPKNIVLGCWATHSIVRFISSKYFILEFNELP